jgi:hypothetical protein
MNQRRFARVDGAVLYQLLVCDDRRRNSQSGALGEKSLSRSHDR